MVDFNEKIAQEDEVYAGLVKIYEHLSNQLKAFGNSMTGSVLSEVRIKISDLMGKIEKKHTGVEP